MRKPKISKKRQIALSLSIILIVAVGLCLAFCIICGIERQWIEFSICLVIAVILILVIIPLNYVGAIYECPKCGQKFKANPYKAFFMNVLYLDFITGLYSPKSKKLKCPHCKTKDWCKEHFE